MGVVDAGWSKQLWEDLGVRCYSSQSFKRRMANGIGSEVVRLALGRWWQALRSGRVGDDDNNTVASFYIYLSIYLLWR